MAKRNRRQALSRERERRVSSAEALTPPAATRREAASTCAWCGGAIDLQMVGRIPKWCSQSCRQRAWEQKRAAESGRAAVVVVERVVAVPPKAGPPAATRPRPADWSSLLDALADDLNRARIYPRDLPQLAIALDQVLTAYRRNHR